MRNGLWKNNGKKYFLGMTMAVISVNATAADFKWSCASSCVEVRADDTAFGGSVYLTSNGNTAKEAFEKLLQNCAAEKIFNKYADKRKLTNAYVNVNNHNIAQPSTISNSCVRED